MLVCLNRIFILVVFKSVSQSYVKLQAEPGFAFEFVLGVVVIKRVVVFRIELPCVACVFKEYGQLELSFDAWRPVDEVDQVESLVDAAVPEQGTVKRIFVDDYQHGIGD